MGDLDLHPLKANKFNSSKIITIPAFDYHILAGNAYSCSDSTANIGGEAAPADAIEISFTTPAATTTDILASFSGFCSTAAASFTLREGFTAGGTGGGAATQTNLNRVSSNTGALVTPLITNTLITANGTVLYQQVLTAGERNYTPSFLLSPATKYGISVFLNGAGVADVQMLWCER